MVRYDAGIHSNSGKQINSCQFDLVSSRDLTDINMNTSIFILILLVTVCSTAPVLSPGKGKESVSKQVSLSRVSVKRSKRLCSQRDTWVHSSKQFGSFFFSNLTLFLRLPLFYFAVKVSHDHSFFTKKDKENLSLSILSRWLKGQRVSVSSSVFCGQHRRKKIGEFLNTG